MSKRDGIVQSAAQGGGEKGGGGAISFIEKLNRSWDVSVEIIVPKSSSSAQVVESKAK